MHCFSKLNNMPVSVGNYVVNGNNAGKNTFEEITTKRRNTRETPKTKQKIPEETITDRNNTHGNDIIEFQLSSNKMIHRKIEVQLTLLTYIL